MGSESSFALDGSRAAGAMAPARPVRHARVLPGFGLTLGFTLTYLSVLVIVPLAGVVWRAAGLDVAETVAILTSPRVIAALRLSFTTALAAAALSSLAGMLIAWVLVRYTFPGKRLFDAAIDLPFALPTAVAGIALTALYAPHTWLGQTLATVGIKVAYTPLGIVIACVFIGLPFVVRSVQPVLQEAERELEEAAASLGANRWQTISRVIFPSVLPALLTGFALAFARAVGEYGSIIFIAGNLPGVSEIAPLLIVIKLEEFDYAGASVIAAAMLALAFMLLIAINGLQAWASRRHGRSGLV